MVKRKPAKSILLPVISGVMARYSNPNFISGYAHPHTTAAVMAKHATHTGRWNKGKEGVGFSAFSTPSLYDILLGILFHYSNIRPQR